MLLRSSTRCCGHRIWHASPLVKPTRKGIPCATGQQPQDPSNQQQQQHVQPSRSRSASLTPVPGPTGRRRTPVPLVRQLQQAAAPAPVEPAQPPAAAQAAGTSQTKFPASNGSTMPAQQHAQHAVDSDSQAGTNTSTPSAPVLAPAAAPSTAATAADQRGLPPRPPRSPPRPRGRLAAAARPAARPPVLLPPAAAPTAIQQQQPVFKNNPIDGQAFMQEPSVLQSQQPQQPQQQQQQQQQVAVADASSLQASSATSWSVVQSQEVSHSVKLAAVDDEQGPVLATGSSSSNAVEDSSSSGSSAASKLLQAQQLMLAAMSKNYQSELWDASNLQDWQALEAEMAQGDTAQADSAMDSANTAYSVHQQDGSSDSVLQSKEPAQEGAAAAAVVQLPVAQEHAAAAGVVQGQNRNTLSSSSSSNDTPGGDTPTSSGFSSTSSSRNGTRNSSPTAANGSVSSEDTDGAAASSSRRRSRSSSTTSRQVHTSLQPSRTGEGAATANSNGSSSGGSSSTSSSAGSTEASGSMQSAASDAGSMFSSSSGVGQKRDSAASAALANGLNEDDTGSSSSSSQGPGTVPVAPPASAASSSSSSTTTRRRSIKASSSNNSSSSSSSGLAAVAQLVAGQRDLAAAQRRASSANLSAAAADTKNRQKTAASGTSNGRSSSSSSSRSVAEKPGDVSQLLGKWVVTGFEEDKTAIASLVPALQSRLRSAVAAEQQHEEAMLKALYNKGSLKRLQKDGLLLLGLQALPHSVLYSSMVWRFSAKKLGKQLPYHRFRQGDSLLISRVNESDAVTVGHNNSSRGSNSREVTSSRSGGKQDSWNGNSSSNGSGGVWPGNDGGLRPIDATVLEVRKDHLLLTVDKSDSDLMQRVLAQAAAAAMVSWRLDQSVRDTTARRQFEAINRLKHLRVQDSAFEQLLRYCLVGTPSGHYIASLPPVWVRDKAWREDVKNLLAQMENLNNSQRAAIAQAVVRSLTLWQGPPGTGKTRTLLALVEALVKTALKDASRWQQMGPLLACADTNAAVDNLVQGLLNKGLDVVRIGQPAKVRPELRHVTLEALAEATPLGQRAAALRATSKALFERAKLAAEGSLLGWASSSSSTVSPSAKSAGRSKAATGAAAAVAGVTAGGVGLLDSEALEADAKRNWAKAEQMTREAAQIVLSEAHVVCATCSGAGDPVLSDLHFNVVVIDEATQATEPATLVPLTQGVQCAVMAGDPAQLPPTIVSREAYKYDLDRTLFDRLQQAVGIAPLLLDTQYRMHPAISQFPSRWFYGGRLKDGVTAAAKPPAAGIPWPVPDAPMLMVAINGLEEKAEKSGQKFMNGTAAGVTAAPVDLSASTEAGLEDASYRNLPEARVALQALHALMSTGDAASGAILTPYKGQVRSLEYGLRVLAPYFAGMEVSVSSVDGYQGREADVIVFSAVRCNTTGKIGFVSDPRRLNVAITRPRRGLVVVCSPQTLSKGSQDWRAFVQTCQQQEWVAGPEQVPAAPWQIDGVDPFAARPADVESAVTGSSSTEAVSSNRGRTATIAESLGSV